MKAFQYRQVDKQNEAHRQAWLNHLATATKEQGKKQVPVFKTYKEFFDYEKALKSLEENKKKITPKLRKMARLAAKVNERG